jgi:dolichol-phosphate mannosyltransferase
MLLSIVIPIYNETAAIHQLLSTIRSVMATEEHYTYEVVLVDDGSTDGSSELLRQVAAEDSRVKVLFFSRNFGHQAAITAGLDVASGDAVVVMDGDLQDPPELLPDMLKLFQQGFDVVSAQRESRAGERRMKLYTARLFYWFMRKMVSERVHSEVGDFRMFSRRAVVAIRQFREQHRFMRGMVAWLGLKEVILPYHRKGRTAGETKYTWIKMLRLAWTAISSFSALPLLLSIYLGFFVTLCGFGYLAFTLFARFVLKATVPGWTSLVCLNIIFSGATLLSIGLVGEYVARIYEEAKERPLYVVSNSINLQNNQPLVARAVILPPVPSDC